MVLVVKYVVGMRVAYVTESYENLKYCFPFTLELPADLNPGCKRVLTQTHIIQCPHTLLVDRLHNKPI